MALINCKNCGQRISNKAIICPKCGIEVSVNNKKKGFSVLTISLIILISGIISFVLFYFWCGNPSNFCGEDLNDWPINKLGELYNEGIVVPIILTLILSCVGILIAFLINFSNKKK